MHFVFSKKVLKYIFFNFVLWLLVGLNCQESILESSLDGFENLDCLRIMKIHSDRLYNNSMHIVFLKMEISQQRHSAYYTWFAPTIIYLQQDWLLQRQTQFKIGGKRCLKSYMCARVCLYIINFC